MKILVAYYSRTGRTKKVGEEIARILKADIDEIIDLTNRKGAKGYLLGGRDAMRKRSTNIKFKKKPSDYDLVIIGTPIWGWNLCPAIRRYLVDNKFTKLCFFSTSGGTNPEKVFEEMKDLSKKPIETLWIKQDEADKNNFKKKVEEYCKKIKK